jgi:hypothetical protein
MNPHWQHFIGDITWLLYGGKTAEVGDAAPPGSWDAASPEFEQLFPELYGLLRDAWVTPIAVEGKPYRLFTWLGSDGGVICGWLCPPPPTEIPDGLLADHRVLFESFGGIEERSNEPLSWICSHNDVLTASLARQDATFLKDWALVFPDGPIPTDMEEFVRMFVEVPIPIDMEQFYIIAEEANANRTLCHRVTGEIALFAHDHNYDYIEPYPGCPEDLPLYRLPTAPYFRDWIRIIAQQWRSWIDQSGGDPPVGRYRSTFFRHYKSS